MADFVNNVPWYTVWDAKSGDLLASGTAAMCARRLGYASANSFASSYIHCQGRQAARQVHLSAGAHPAQRGGQPDATPEKGAP